MIVSHWNKDSNAEQIKPTSQKSVSSNLDKASKASGTAFSREFFNDCCVRFSDS